MEIKTKSFDQKDSFPPIVYKHRSWTDNFHKAVISEQVVFMARPTSFKDPLDCKSQKRYDLFTENDIYNTYLESSKLKKILIGQD